MLISAAFMALLLPAAGQAATLEVRGRLTDRNGQPQDGACLLRFHVSGSDPESPGSWSDAIYVDVEEGLFRSVLGKDRPIPDAALSKGARVSVEAPRGTGWRALASPLAEPARPPARSSQPEPVATEPADETAKLKARIEALEKQVQPEDRERKARIYEVKPGDTLQGIAAKLWGDATRWSELYSANADRLGRGGEVTAGQRLLVPELGR